MLTLAVVIYVQLSRADPEAFGQQGTRGCATRQTKGGYRAMIGIRKVKERQCLSERWKRHRLGCGQREAGSEHRAGKKDRRDQWSLSDGARPQKTRVEDESVELDAAWPWSRAFEVRPDMQCGE
ncbi:hypothetical protein BJX99DRAFT_135607 [Aspergillus californicus]